jgi:class 3 adenylate cyclase
VNVASRLEGACEPGCVLASASTWLWLGNAYRSEVQAEIRVKNRDEGVRTYLIDPKSPY